MAIALNLCSTLCRMVIFNNINYSNSYTGLCLSMEIKLLLDKGGTRL